MMIVIGIAVILLVLLIVLSACCTTLRTPNKEKLKETFNIQCNAIYVMI